MVCPTGSRPCTTIGMCARWVCWRWASFCLPFWLLASISLHGQRMRRRNTQRLVFFCCEVNDNCFLNFDQESILGSRLKKIQRKGKSSMDIDTILNEIPTPSIYVGFIFEINRYLSFHNNKKTEHTSISNPTSHLAHSSYDSRRHSTLQRTETGTASHPPSVSVFNFELSKIW